MNKAEFEPYENKVLFDKYYNKTVVETIRIESDFYFLQASQSTDFPKEREIMKW